MLACVETEVLLRIAHRRCTLRFHGHVRTRKVLGRVLHVHIFHIHINGFILTCRIFKNRDVTSNLNYWTLCGKRIEIDHTSIHNVVSIIGSHLFCGSITIEYEIIQYIVTRKGNTINTDMLQVDSHFIRTSYFQ